MRIYMLSITSPHHRPLFSTSVTVAEDGSVNLFDMATLTGHLGAPAPPSSSSGLHAVEFTSRDTVVVTAGSSPCGQLCLWDFRAPVVQALARFKDPRAGCEYLSVACHPVYGIMVWYGSVLWQCYDMVLCCAVVSRHLQSVPPQLLYVFPSSCPCATGEAEAPGGV